MKHDDPVQFFHNHNIKGVFFDWDGTLVNSLVMIVKTHNHARKQLGMPDFTEETFLPYFGRQRDQMYIDVYREHADFAKAEFEKFYTENHLQEMVLIDGATKLVKGLAERKIPMGVVSNKKGEFLRAEVNHLGWIKYFSAIIGSGDAPQDKPSGVPLKLAVSQVSKDLAISEILYVGDTNTDYLCASDAGCPLAYIESPENPLIVDSENGAPFITFKNIREFSEAFLNFCSKS